jgi:hypothetical protein
MRVHLENRIDFRARHRRWLSIVLSGGEDRNGPRDFLGEVFRGLFSSGEAL